MKARANRSETMKEEKRREEEEEERKKQDPPSPFLPEISPFKAEFL